MSETKAVAETQDAALAESHQKRQQQRQILTLMGVTPWVQRSAITLKISQTAPATELQRLELSREVAPLQNADFAPDTHSRFNGEIEDHRFDNEVIETRARAIDEALTATKAAPNVEPESQEVAMVAPFVLDTVAVGDWVLLVDVEALSSDRALLWRNIVSALGLKISAFSFPLCDGMRDKMLAEASLAGHIFNICSSKEDVFVAALTQLPSKIGHPNIRPLPTLDDMLTDADAKRRFWQQISTRLP